MASVRSCIAYMHCTACTEQRNTSRGTHYSRNSHRLQDIISLVDLTFAAPQDVCSHMCIHYNSIQPHQTIYLLTQHLNASKHEAAAKQEGKVEHRRLRRLTPQVCSDACTLL